MFLNPIILFVNRLKTSTYNIPENKRTIPKKIVGTDPYINNKIKNKMT